MSSFVLNYKEKGKSQAIELSRHQPIDDNDPRPLPELAEADDIETEAFDKLISARVCIPQGDKMAYGTVARRKRDADGTISDCRK